MEAWRGGRRGRWRLPDKAIQTLPPGATPSKGGRLLRVCVTYCAAPTSCFMTTVRWHETFSKDAIIMCQANWYKGVSRPWLAHKVSRASVGEKCTKKRNGRRNREEPWACRCSISIFSSSASLSVPFAMVLTNIFWIRSGFNSKNVMKICSLITTIYAEMYFLSCSCIRWSLRCVQVQIFGRDSSHVSLVCRGLKALFRLPAKTCLVLFFLAFQDCIQIDFCKSGQ